MADKISLEFEARDEQLKSQMAQLKSELSSLGDDANYTDSLEQNVNSINKNIERIEALRRSISMAVSEASELNGNLSAGGTVRSRRNQQEAFNSLQETRMSASRTYNNSRGATKPVTVRDITKSTPGYYTPRVNEAPQLARQREDARYALSEERHRYANLSRDSGTENRSLEQSARRIGNRIEAGGYISSGERITANNNLNRAYNRLTDNGTYSDTSGKIGSLESLRSNNNNARDALQSQINTTYNGREHSQLSQAEQNVVEQLQSQRDLLRKQNEGINDYIQSLEKEKSSYDKLNTSMQSSNAKYAPTSGLSSTLFRRSQNIANGVVYGGAAATLGLAVQGNSIINQNQPYTRAIGASNGTYDSRAAQLSAQRAGMQYGLTGSNMLQAENAYMQGRGYTSNSDMSAAGVNTGMFAKINGLTMDQSTALTSVYANNTTGDARGLKDVQDAFYGSLKQAGLTNRSYSQSSQLSSILGTYSAARGGQTTSQGLSEQAAVQNTLGSTGNSALLGQNGATFMNQMNSSIIGQGANSNFMQFALMQSDPSKYNGSYNGYANIVDQTQNGLDGTNLKAIAGVGKMFGPRSSSFLAQSLKTNFGVSVTSKTAGDIMKVADSGQLDGLSNKKMITQLQKSGAISSDEAKQMQQSSSDASYDKGQAAFEKASTTVGNLTRNMSAFALRITGGSAAVTILGTAALGAAATLGKIGLSTGLSNVIRSSTSQGGGGTGLFGGLGSSKTGTGSSATGATRMSRLESRTTLGGRIVNSRAGQAVSSGIEAIGATTAGGFIKSGAAKATGLASKATGLFSNVASKVAPIAGKALPWAQAGLNGVQLVSDVAGGASKKQTSQDAWGLAGTVGGTLLGTAFGPGGMMLGGMLGGLVGNGVGSLFGGTGSKGSQQKDDESLTNRKIQAETLRAKNIKDDDVFVNKYGRAVTRKDVLTSSTSSDSASSSDSSQSPFQNYKNTGTKIGAATGGSSTTKVVISGTINHQGEVTDTSQVTTSVDGVLDNLFNNVNPNETKRK